MNFESWMTEVPSAIRNDSLWKMEAYRLGLFASDVAWRDVRKLADERITRSLSDQLYRSVGSISANIAEGYSRGTGKDRARFYEYALGSARESRDWYYKGRFVLGKQVMNHRLNFMSSITRLLLTMIPQQRAGQIREPAVEYEPPAEQDLSVLLEHVPFTD